MNLGQTFTIHQAILAFIKAATLNTARFQETDRKQDSGQQNQTK